MATDNRRKRSKKKSAAAPVKSVRRTRPPRRSEPAATEAGRTTAAEVSRLRQSELLYRELVQNANSAIIRWKGDGTIAFFNEYAESFFGYKAEEVVGKNVRLLVPPQESTGTDLTTLISDIVANPDKYVNNVNENVCRDGRRVWMAWTNKPIFDETGQVSEILAVGSDITARKQAEEALRDSEARLAFALETIYTGAWELDLVDQTAHRSLTHDRIFGYESLLPRWTFEMFLEHVLPEDREEVARKFRHAVQTKTDWAFECRILRVDGEVRWIWAAGRHQPDAAGEMRRLAGVVQDITARKQAEEALRDSERRAREQAEELAVLLEAVPMPVFVARDPDCLHLTGNRASDEILRLPHGAELSLTGPAETRPSHFRPVKDGRELPLDELPAQRSARGEQVKGFEFDLVFDDDLIRHVLGYGQPLFDAAGRPRGSVAVLLDITARKRAEEELRGALEEKKFLADVLEFSSQPFAVGYPDGRLGLMNQAFEKLTGYTSEELNALDWATTLTPPEWREVEREKLEALHRTGQPIRYEKEYLRKDGSRVAIDLLVHVVRDDAGKPLYYYTFLTDITARKRAEEAQRKLADAALRLSEKEFLALAESVPQIVWATRPDGGTIYFNQQWVDYTGLTMEESYGPGWNKPFHPDDRQRAWEAWQRATKYLEPYSLECRLRRADGAYRWWLIRGAPMRGENGEILKWFGTCTDIEDLKNAEAALKEANERLEQRVAERTEALRQSEEQFRALAEAIPNLAWWANADGYITWYNRRWYEYTGTTSQQMEGWGWQSVHDPQALPEVLERWKTSIATGEPFDMTFPLRGADGQFRRFLTRIQPLKDAQGRVVKWFGTNTDVEELKRAEESLQKTTQRLYRILSGMYSAVLLVTDEGRVEFANQAFCDVFHLPDSPADLVGLEAPAMIAKIRPTYQNPDQAVARIREIVAHGQPVKGEEVVMADGGLYLRNFVPLQVDGKSFGRLWVHIDITARKQAEEKLAAQHAELQLIMDAAPASIFYKDRENHFVRVNRAFAEIMGRPREELEDRSLLELYPAAQAEAFHRDDLEVIASGRPKLNIIEPMQTPAGEIWVQTDKVPCRDAAGNIIGVIGFALDITERKRAEEALQRSESILRSITDNSPDPIFLKDRQCRLIFANPATLKVIGKPESEVLGKTDEEFYDDPVVGRAIMANDLRIMETGLDETVEEVVKNSDGASRIFLSTKSLLRDAQGQTVGLVGVARDITERKRAETLLSARLRLSELAAHASMDEVMQAALDEAERLTGSCIGFFHFVDEDQENLRLQAWSGNTLKNMCQAEGKGQHYPISQAGVWVECFHARAPVIHNDYPALAHKKGLPAGHAPIVREMTVPVLRDGKVVAIIGVGNKATDYSQAEVAFLQALAVPVMDLVAVKQSGEALRQSAEELARSNKELEQFAYVASHDLQEPLRGVIGFTKLLQERYQGRLDAKADEYIGFAVEGATRMNALILDLLSYSRVGANGQTLVPTDLEAPLFRALANLKISIDESGAEVTRDELPTVAADPGQITQLFQNLIGNAIKFHGDRKPEIHVGARINDGQWLFSVRDNGIGLDMKHQERIFQIFQRLHARDAYPGTGIGLAICKKIVEGHGGRIWVESQPGQGTTFYFTLSEGKAAVQPMPRWC